MTHLTSPLLALLRARSVRDNPYAIDVSACSMFSEAAPLIGEIIYEQTESIVVDAIGGPPDSVPLVMAAVIGYHMHDQKMEGFWVRDITDHGMKKLIEGNLKPGSKVAIVVEGGSTGMCSAFHTVLAVQAAGCQVVLVLALVGGPGDPVNFFEGLGIEYRAIFKTREDDEDVWSGDFTGGVIS